MPRRRRSDKDDLKPVYENAVGFDITPEVWGALTQMDIPSMLRVSTWLRDVCKRNRQHGLHVGVQSAMTSTGQFSTELKDEELAVGFYWVRLTDYGSVLTVAEWLGAEWHFTGTDEAQPSTKVVVVKAISKP